MIPREQLVPGTQYLVRLNDCCLHGALEGIFLRFLDSDFNLAQFSFGILEDPAWGAEPFDADRWAEELRKWEEWGRTP